MGRSGILVCTMSAESFVEDVELHGAVLTCFGFYADIFEYKASSDSSQTRRPIRTRCHQPCPLARNRP